MSILPFWYVDNMLIHFPHPPLSPCLSLSLSLSLLLSLSPSLSLPVCLSLSLTLHIRTVLHGYQLCQGEQAVSLTSCTLGESADTRSTFYVVGTAFVDVGEKEPTQGRVLVFSRKSTIYVHMRAVCVCVCVCVCVSVLPRRFS